MDPPEVANPTMKAKVPKICKICDNPAAGARFGVDSCRACAAFFRRSFKSGMVFNSNSCKCRKFLVCQHCRFDRCVAEGMVPTLNLRQRIPKREVSPPIPNVLTSHTQIILLHRLLANHRDFTRERLEFEREFYSLRIDSSCSTVQLTPPDEQPFTVYVAKFAQIREIYEGVADRSMKNLTNSFEEMYSMKEEDKSLILHNALLLLFCSEGFYRGAKTFTDRPLDRYFISLTTTIRMKDFDNFFEGSENMNHSEQIERKCQLLNKRCRDMLVPIFDRMELTEIEYVSIMIIALWSLSISTKHDSQMSKICEGYQRQVLKELHVLDIFKLDNYAARLGELMILSIAIQMSAKSFLSELQLVDVMNMYKEGHRAT